MTAISIVIPVYGRFDLLEQTLQSLREQEFKNFHVILVDDGSEPPLRLNDLASSSGLKVACLHQPNRGPGAARNVGVSAAEGEYVLFLDSDDLLTAMALEELFSAARSGSARVVVGSWVNFSDDGQCHSLRPSKLYDDALANAVIGGWPTGAVLVSKVACPVISETRMPWEMAECWLEALGSHDSRLVTLDSCVARVRQKSRDSLTLKHDHFERVRAANFWQEMKARFGNNPERTDAFDKRIFECAFDLFHSGEVEKAETVFSMIDLGELAKHSWVKRFGPAWFSRAIGFRQGLRWQSRLSHMLEAMRRDRDSPA